jgi:hypothetical protein
VADYILTYTKIKFYPLEPVKDDIKVEDIAHSLSQLARANGHFEHFYSVAHHAINCCKEARARGYSKRVQLGCLLHDGSESYIMMSRSHKVYELFMVTEIFKSCHRCIHWHKRFTKVGGQKGQVFIGSLYTQ